MSYLIFSLLNPLQETIFQKANIYILKDTTRHIFPALSYRKYIFRFYFHHHRKKFDSFLPSAKYYFKYFYLYMPLG